MATKEEQSRRNFVHRVEVLMASALAEHDLSSEQAINHGFRRRVMWAAAGAMATAAAVTALLVVPMSGWFEARINNPAATPRVAAVIEPKVAEVRTVKVQAHPLEKPAEAAAQYLTGSVAPRAVVVAVPVAVPRAPGELDKERARQQVGAKRLAETAAADKSVAEERARQEAEAKRVVEGTVRAGEAVSYASAQAAFQQGLDAYKAGHYEIAIPALEEAAARGAELNKFFAEFYLARIFSDNGSAFTDHAKAYALFQKFADGNADVDRADGQRAPFVAKALTALAGYLREGITAIGLRPDPERAVDYLHHAATFFGDKEAQFELARVYLSGRGTAEDVKRGMHYLSVLTEEGYPGAQAYLADLYWRGRYVKRDERRALALIRVAVENAPKYDRIWIEDIYQNIYCGASQGTRQQADGIVARWRKIFSHPSPSGERMGLGAELQPQRACGNGEVVDIPRPTSPP